MHSVYSSVFAHDVLLPLQTDGLPAAAAAELSDEKGKEDSPQPPARGDSPPHCHSGTNVQLPGDAPEGAAQTGPGCHQGWPAKRAEDGGAGVLQAQETAGGAGGGGEGD